MKKTITVGLYGQRSSKSGLGRFAKDIVDGFSRMSQFKVCLLDDEMSVVRDLDIIVYASRSAENLRSATELRRQLDIPLLLLATGLEESLEQFGDTGDIQLIPNSSTDVLNYRSEVIDFWSAHKDWMVAITEYHQQSKADVSGTALDIAEQIGFPASMINSVRDDKRVQKQYDLSASALDGYAIHKVEFTSPQRDVTTSFEVSVVGRDTYVRGLAAIIMQKLSNRPRSS